MPSNYSDNPSMDEILSRIKKALAEREHKVSQSDEFDDSLQSDNTFSSDSGTLTFEKMKEFSSSKPVTEKIVNNLIEDEIFIKPVIKNNSDTIDNPYALSKNQKVENDVFVLTKSMKVNKVISLDGIDLDAFCGNLAKNLGRDLAISYLEPKIENWLKKHLKDVIKNSKK